MKTNHFSYIKLGHIFWLGPGPKNPKIGPVQTVTHPLSWILISQTIKTMAAIYKGSINCLAPLLVAQPWNGQFQIWGRNALAGTYLIRHKPYSIVSFYIPSPSKTYSFTEIKPLQVNYYLLSKM